LPLFREGDSVDVILEEARPTDLIVVGSHGRTGLSHSVLGSVAYSVLKRADEPVLAVRDPARRFLR
jgi:nucleotide-binding universal stress UspA family protein